MFRITQVQFVGIISICVFIEVLLHLFRIIYNKRVLENIKIFVRQNQGQGSRDKASKNKKD